MNFLVENLKSRNGCFTMTIPARTDAKEWVELQLLSSPYILTTISGISFRAIPSGTNAFQLHFTVKYRKISNPGMVFGVKDMFELITAVSVSLKCHLPKMVVVIDNRSGFVAENQIVSQIKRCKEYVGEELGIHQFNSSRFSWSSFFNNRIIICTLETNYFDTAKDINDLSCILAEQAQRIRENCGNNGHMIVNSIMKWFRENIEYKNTAQIADHSAVGLYKNKTAVCQGIAAYAYLLLSYCGLEARYVSGEGEGGNGWGPHGWNMVKLNEVWHHIDYTFELNSRRLNVIMSEEKFRKDHRWDAVRYSRQRSDELSTVRRTLKASVIILLPNEDCISINGCLVDVTGYHRICKVINTTIYVALLDIVNLYGGCSNLNGDSMYIYLGVHVYKIPFRQLRYHEGVWYIHVLWLKNLGIRLTIDKDALVLQNENG